MELHYSQARPFILMDGETELKRSEMLGVFYTVDEDGLCTLRNHGDYDSIVKLAKKHIQRISDVTIQESEFEELMSNIIEKVNASSINSPKTEQSNKSIYQEMIDEVRVIDVTHAMLDDINYLLDRSMLKEKFFLRLNVIESESTVILEN